MTTRDFLELVGGVHQLKGYEYGSVYDLVLREAYDYPMVGSYTGKRGIKQQCFRNALWLAVGEGLVYVEGYATGPIPGIHHAWCYDPESGEVIDCTWREPGTEYLGIPFTLEDVVRITDENGKYGVLDDWENRWPLCRTPLARHLVDEQGIPASSRQSEAIPAPTLYGTSSEAGATGDGLT